MIRYLFDEQGGFLCGDDLVASYAYATSPHATKARRACLARVAREMVRAGNSQWLVSIWSRQCRARRA